MAEVDILKIQWNTKDDGIDFSVQDKHDNYFIEHAPEIIRILRKLADNLEKHEYPFSNLRERN